MKRYSRQREIILDVLKNRNDHPNVDMLYEDVKKKLPNIGIATIYRNLSELCNEGTIIKVKTKTGGPERYDGNITPHIHFECEKCKNVYDIFGNKEVYMKLNEYMKKMSKTINAEALSMEMLITGMCKNCK